MKFEEALAALREGAKIWHPTFADDEYLAACRIGLIGDDTPLEERPISIVRIKGDRQHDSMAGKLNYVAKIKRDLKKILSEEDFKKYHRCLWTEIEISKIFDEDVFMYPQLNLLLIMAEDWEIL
jgi:hypothetical protein